jgi:hypothetical protein
MAQTLNLEERFAETFAEFERNEAPFLSRIKRKLDSLPEKDRGIDDLLQTVKLECWKSNLLDKKHPVRYIKTCLKNFVNKQIRSRLTTLGGLHYLVSTDEEGFQNSGHNSALSAEPAAQSALEAAETLKIILKCLDPDELTLFKFVFWENAGSDDVYGYFREIRHPGGAVALTEGQIRAFKDRVRQEKCRMIKKVHRIQALIHAGRYDDEYIKRLTGRNYRRGD